MFFGSINKFKRIINPNNFKEKIIIIDCSECWIWDQSSIDALGKITEKFRINGKELNIVNLGPSSHKLIKKAEKIIDLNVFD